MSSDHSITKEQPQPTPPPSAGGIAPPSRKERLREKALRYKEKLTTREGWLGDYDYFWLCMPTLPTLRSQTSRRLPPFYSLHGELPLLLAAACGLQHALAMLAGLITPPIIFASALRLDSETSAYMISASLISCGKFPSRVHSYFVFYPIVDEGRCSRDTD